MTSPRKLIDNARSMRAAATRSEGLLWSALRGSQLSGLKFRRQHPIPPFILDFACAEHRLVIEIDGGYHDEKIEYDLKRQSILEQAGWKILRFTDKEIEDDFDAVLLAIVQSLQKDFEFRSRKRSGSGMKWKPPHAPRKESS